MNPYILLAMAIGPVLAIIIYFYTKDKNDREPIGVLLVSFLWGCFSVVPALILEYSLPGLVPGSTGASLLSIGIYTFVVIAMSEELCKFIFLRYYAYKKPSFNEPYDGIIYAVMVGMGFATVENLMYIFNSDGGGWGTAAIRAVTAVPAHATFAALMGYYVGLAKFNKAKSKKLLLQGLVYAIILHGFYDFFLFQNLSAALYIGAALSLVIGIRFARHAIKLHKESPLAIHTINEPTMQTEIVVDNSVHDAPQKPS